MTISKKYWPIIWVTLLQLLLGKGTIFVSSEDMEVEFTSGIQIVPQSPPTFFNSFLALLVQNAMPEFGYKEFDIPILTSSYKNVASNSYYVANNYASSGRTVLTYFFHKFVNSSLSRDLSLWKDLPLKPDSKPTNESGPMNLCDDIGQNSLHSFASTVDLKKYAERLRHCFLGEDKVTLTTSSHDPSSRLPFFTDMARRAGDQMYSIGGTTNTYLALGLGNTGQSHAINMLLMHHHMESQRWENAVARCQSQRIPYTLLPKSELMDHLTPLQSRLLKKGYKLSIPLEDLASYYKLPIADCTILEGGSTFVTRILIPIQEQTADYELVRFKSLPFLRAEGEERKLCFVKQMENRAFVVDKRSKAFIESKCECGELCQIPKQNKDWPFIADPCVSALLSDSGNSSEDIRKHCELECSPFLSNRSPSTPIFRTLASDTLVMTGGNENSKVFMQCTKAAATIIHEMIKPVELGSLKIKVPCDCQLVSDGEEIFRSLSPCSTDKITKTVIRPLAWQTIERIIDATEPEQNASEGITDVEKGNIVVNDPETEACACSTSQSSILLHSIQLLAFLVLAVILGWVVVKLHQTKQQILQIQTRMPVKGGQCGTENNTYEQILFLNN
jgi:hypothetical protein